MQGDDYFWGSEFSTDWRQTGSGRWRLRWSSLKYPASKGIWQVTVFPPALSATNWQKPAGLVAQGFIDPPKKGDATVFEIDFSRFAPKPPSTAGGDRASTTVRDPTHYYVRVVQLDASDKPVGRPSTAVRIRYGTPEPPVKLPYVPGLYNCPTGQVRLLKYTPLKAGEPYHYLVTRDFLAFNKGQHLYLKPGKKKKDFLEQVGDAVEDAISDVGSFAVDAVGWVSEAYDDIKAAAVNLAAGVLRSSGLPCGPTCEAALAAGLNAGLAAVGMPPSLPNFDQMVAMGEGYLVETLAAQAQQELGVPEDVARRAAAETLKQVKQEAVKLANHGPGGNEWLRPHPDYVYQHARFEVEVSNPTKQQIGGSVLVHVEGIYRPARLPVSLLKPGQRLVIPALLPEFDGDYWYEIARRNFRSAFGPENYWSEAWESWGKAMSKPAKFQVKFTTTRATVRGAGLDDCAPQSIDASITHLATQPYAM
jgi:hypothetical protein